MICRDGWHFWRSCLIATAILTLSPTLLMPISFNALWSTSSRTPPLMSFLANSSACCPAPTCPSQLATCSSSQPCTAPGPVPLALPAPPLGPWRSMVGLNEDSPGLGPIGGEGRIESDNPDPFSESDSRWGNVGEEGLDWVDGEGKWWDWAASITPVGLPLSLTEPTSENERGGEFGWSA